MCHELFFFSLPFNKKSNTSFFFEDSSISSPIPLKSKIARKNCLQLSIPTRRSSPSKNISLVMWIYFRSIKILLELKKKNGGAHRRLIQELTLADLASVPVSDRLINEAKLSLTEGRPNVERWLNELLSRDSWQKVKSIFKHRV